MNTIQESKHTSMHANLSCFLIAWFEKCAPNMAEIYRM
jgi:hypothetical protein